jgi:MFS transporter, Spinster family, sphingosine-1-phosphate transporter
MLPTGLLFAFAPSLLGSIVGLCLVSICLSAWLGPAFGLSLALAPPHLRGVTSATIQLFCNLFGSAIGPLLAGVLSDAFHGDLQSALGWTIGLSLWSALHFALAARATRAASAVATPEAGALAGLVSH